MSLIGSAAAACSGDTMRFAENPFSNPFANSERIAPGTPTASQNAPSYAGAPSYAAAPLPTPSVQAQALPPVQAQPLSHSSRMAAAPVQQPRPAPLSPPPAQPKMRFVDQTKVATSDQPVPVEPVRRTRPGMQTAAAAPAPVQTKPVPVQQVASATDEPLVSPARPLVSPARPVESQKVAAIEPQPVKSAPAATQTVAPAPEPAPQPQTVKAPVKEPEQTASLSPGNFRWPARGRVIAGFGANGGNEGINIAVPEGTPVKAAEAGTVTYAGSEVKGYGNLILVRHDNGYVTAYAHNSALNVKRGDQVKRGQVIAIAGQTGNVTSPQLHFEIRKGATPVDPIKHLAD
ncbi:M23 family metallopeptidase [Microvirga makkahensis]|uniref:M23 family metallopeptidase n=1 Tax=Microvirga makkahensis TaxID=1128670 RepID=UPI0031B619A5